MKGRGLAAGGQVRVEHHKLGSSAPSSASFSPYARFASLSLFMSLSLQLIEMRDEFRARFDIVLAHGGMPVPGDVVFHEGDALAFHRVGDDDCGFALEIFRCAEGLVYPIDVVAVDVDDIPAEGSPAVAQGSRGMTSSTVPSIWRWL